ncbi:uncharacterized protein LTR77_002682 [Saxophila tyrrhenica]|uniref:CRIB domain-containing protein n=1 Tax=Saxophila tyrrhenica TaxID=1690608 RepID=A0AAV9PIG8_9PEZI|nr:hypothetical protein LTR77_002682 [Saxophila tyrrhenica]
MDRHSPFAPAHICALVLPVGQITREKFLSVVEGLRGEAAVISLADVTPHLGDDDILLHPRASPSGALLYNYTTAAPSELQHHLSPFELFREPLLVIGIVDGLQDLQTPSEVDLEAASAFLKERHPRVVDRQLIVLGDGQDGNTQPKEDNVVFINQDWEINGASTKEALCQMSARFLKELSTYTKALQASPSIQTPGQTARNLQREVAYRESERRPGSASGRSTPSQSEATSPIEESSRQPPWNRGIPATSFDQIQGASSLGSGLSRTDSQSSSKGKHGRTTSQDRITVQGFGSGTSQDKIKQRGKARVGIVIGSIYMMAGHYSEALRMLSEHTTKARALSDSIWQAKGLENIVICLLLSSWAGVEFQIPSICYASLEKSGQRLSVALRSDFRRAEAAQQASIRSLSTAIPDLLELTLSLYRSTEGPLELPVVPVADATVRFGKLLAILHISDAHLDTEALNPFVGTNKSKDRSALASTRHASNGPSKVAIAEFMSNAQPTLLDNVPDADHIAILAGIAGVYSLIALDRKKGIVLKELVSVLTSALTLARKRHAAEMGIQPGGTYPTELRADAVLTASGPSTGLDGLINELARIYGFDLVETEGAKDSTKVSAPSFFGGDSMKLDILSELAAFCEATPSPQGILRLNASLLRSFGPKSAIDTEDSSSSKVVSKEEQEKLTASMTRAVEAARTMGLEDVEAQYWDQFLVRGVELMRPEPALAVVRRPKAKSTTTIAEGSTSGNPLLYDPSASRPGTAEEPKSKIIVKGERSKSVVSLQNPYEVPIQIESLEIVTEGVALEVSHDEPITLGPLRIQEVPVYVTPTDTGDFKIIGCNIKVFASRKQFFPIVKNAFKRVASSLVKRQGQKGRDHISGSGDDRIGLPYDFNHEIHVAAPEMPTLVVDKTPFTEASAQLLDGEKVEFTIVLKNVSIAKSLVAKVFEVATINRTNDFAQTVVRQDTRSDIVAVEQCFTYVGDIVAATRTKRCDIAFTYGKADDDAASPATRRVVAPVQLTILPGLSVSGLEIVPQDKDGEEDWLLCFELGNAFSEAMGVRCVALPRGGGAEGALLFEKAVVPAGGAERVCVRVCRLLPEMIVEGLVLENTIHLARDVRARLSVSWRTEGGREGVVNLASAKVDCAALG